MVGRGSGKTPKPTALKKLQGNPGRRRLNENEPVLQPGEPAMPKLGRIATREWRDIVPLLLTMGVLTPADGKALAAYCSAFEQWMLADQDIRKRGIMVRSLKFRAGAYRRNRKTGETVPYTYYEVRKNPAVGIKSDALKLMKTYLIEFGLTPASRSKLHIEKPTEADPFEEFLRRKADRASKPQVN